MIMTNATRTGGLIAALSMAGLASAQPGDQAAFYQGKENPVRSGLHRRNQESESRGRLCQRRGGARGHR